jgi:O-antigen/teichoic acid export membrane protein
MHGLAFFLLHLSFVGVFQADKLVIANVLGPAEVSGFAVIGRLFLIVLGVVMLVLQPLWPAYGEAFRRGDISWIRRLVRITTGLSCLAYFACGAVMFFFGDWVLALWTRGQAPQVSKMLILGMTATFVFRGWTECQAIALNGAGVLRPQIFFLGTNAVLNVVFAIVFAKLWGVEGVAWSIPVSSLLTSTWGYPWIMRRYVYNRTTEADAAAAEEAPSPILE